MTTYNEIAGRRVNFLSSDPTYVDTNSNGQVWYNSSTATLKAWLPTGAWSSGGNLNTARYNIGGAGASNTAAIYFGGQIIAAAPAALLTNSESYNGTSWTNTPSLNTARATQGFGTQTAAIAAGGTVQPNPTAGASVESWNGSTWTSITSKSQATVASTGVAGIQTAGLVFGGAVGDGSPYVTATESWNGSAWTSGGSMPGNAGAKAMAKGGAGTQTAALSMGGDNGAGDAGAQVFSYNGTSWSAGTSLNTAQRWSGGGGTQTSAICFGGYAPSVSGITQLWNGSAWTTSPNSLATSRAEFSGCGTQASALAAGGFPGSYPGSGPGASNATEEWTVQVGVPVAGSWSSGGNLPATNSGAGATGTQNATILAFGEVSGPPVYGNVALTYNGTSWTSITNASTGRIYPGNLGTQTAALFVGGQTSSGGVTGATEKWNGTTWTTNPTGLNTSRRFPGNSGTDTAGLIFGGDNDAGTIYANAESWNGTSWTATTSMNTARLGLGSSGDGTQTAALGFGGSPGTVYSSATESWNGSSWTTVNSLSTARSYGASFGVQSASVFGDGFNGSNISQTELWNGTSWSTNPSSLATTRRHGAGAGSQTLGLAAGGNSPPGAFLTATEEWTGPGFTYTAKTLTTS